MQLAHKSERLQLHHYWLSCKHRYLFAYLEARDGAFCKYYVLFCPKEVNTLKFGHLVIEKFSNWHCVVEKCNAL